MTEQPLPPDVPDHPRRHIDQVCQSLYEEFPDFDQDMNTTCPELMKRWNEHFSPVAVDPDSKTLVYNPRYDRFWSKQLGALTSRLRSPPAEFPIRKVAGKYDYEIDYFDMARDEELIAPKVVRDAANAYVPADGGKKVWFSEPAVKGDDSSRRKLFWIDNEGKRHVKSIDRLIDKMDIPDTGPYDVKVPDPRRPSRMIFVDPKSPDLAKVSKAFLRRQMTKMAPLGAYQLQIEITDDPVDVFRRSEGQLWTSCERLDGSWGKGTYEDVENWNGVAIIRLAPKGRPLPEAWSGRISLKNCNIYKGGKLTDVHDVGIEDRLYGGVNSNVSDNKANRLMEAFVKNKLYEILESKGLAQYMEHIEPEKQDENTVQPLYPEQYQRQYRDVGTCRTPYDYHGYSDVRSANNIDNDSDIDMPIDYGINQIDESDYKDDEPDLDSQIADLRDEYRHYGVAYDRDADDYEELYWAGNLAELINLALEGRDFEDGDNFESLTGYREVDEDDEGYSAWSALPDLYEQHVDQVKWELNRSRFVMFFPVTHNVYTEGVPLLVRYTTPDDREDWTLDHMRYLDLVDPLRDTVECMDEVSNELDQEEQPLEYRRRKEKCLIEHYDRLWGGDYVLVPDDPADQEKFMALAGDAGWRVCAQVHDLVARDMVARKGRYDPPRPHLDYTSGDPFAHDFMEVSPSWKRDMSLGKLTIPRKSLKRIQGIRNYCNRQGGWEEMRKRYGPVAEALEADLHERELARTWLQGELSNAHSVTRRGDMYWDLEAHRVRNEPQFHYSDEVSEEVLEAQAMERRKAWDHFVEDISWFDGTPDPRRAVARWPRGEAILSEEPEEDEGDD